MQKFMLVPVLWAGLGLAAFAQDRMPPIPAEKMTPEQKQAFDEHVKARGSGAVRGPYAALVRNPPLMAHVRSLADYLRSSSLPPRLYELLALMVAREWSAQYVWSPHVVDALKEGVNPEIVKAIEEGRRPRGMADDEEVLYDFCAELLQNRGVSDATYVRAVAKFGERGVLDAIGVMGNYMLVSMVTNTARPPLPPGGAPPLKPLPN